MDTVQSTHPRDLALSIAALVLLTGFTAVTRTWQVNESLWLDELHTAWAVADSWSDVAPRAEAGNQSPLYFYLTWLSVQVFGPNEIGVRLPAIFCGTLLIPALYFVVLRWTSSHIAALLAAVLAALDHDFLFYGLEARPYAAVQLLGVVQVFLFTQVTIGPEPAGTPAPIVQRAALIALSILLYYLHYTTALLFVGEAVCLGVSMIFFESRRRYGLSAFLIDGTLVTAAYLLSLTHLTTVFERRGNWKAIAEAWPFAGMSLQRFVDIYIQLPLVLLALILVSRWLGSRQPIIDSRPVRCLLPVFCWLCAPIGIACLANAMDWAPLTRLRYVMVALPAFMVISGLCCGMIPTKFFRFVVACIVVVAAIMASNLFYNLKHHGRLNADRNEDWAAVVAGINSAPAHAHTHDWPVFLAPGLIEDHALGENPDPRFKEYCLFPIRGIYSVEPRSRDFFPLPSSNYQPTEEQLAAIRKAHGAWIIVRGPRPRSEAYTRTILTALKRRRGSGHQWEAHEYWCTTQVSLLPMATNLHCQRIIDWDDLGEGGGW